MPVNYTYVAEFWATDGDDVFANFGTGNYDPRYIHLGAGNDTLINSVTGHLPQFVYGGAGDDSIIGAMNVKGDDGNDTIGAVFNAYGGAGNDYVIAFDRIGYDGYSRLFSGGAGDDVIVGGNTQLTTLNGNEGNDQIYGGNAAEKINGGIGDDFLVGGGGNDSILGGTGNDTLSGGAGADYLSGGSGIDIYYYAAASDSGVGAGQRDTINFGYGDKIDLSGLNSDDNLHVVQAFTGAAGEVVIDIISNKQAYVRADMNGDGVADFEIDVTGQLGTSGGHAVITFDQSDLILSHFATA